MATINVGDVVVLNSGGPKMTVHEIISDKAWCCWIHNEYEYRIQEFDLRCIKITT